jgi:hypothetical protein
VQPLGKWYVQRVSATNHFLLVQQLEKHSKEMISGKWAFISDLFTTVRDRDTMPDARSSPPELIGDEAYLDALDERLDADRFPDPDASLIPALTTARFVAEAACDAGETAFAEKIDARRGPVFDPLIQFEVVATLSDDQQRERLAADEFEELVSQAGLNGTISREDDPAVIVEAGLTEREMTFFDYPAPPLHVIESAKATGKELMDRSPDERTETSSDQQQLYIQQRGTIEAVVIGGRDVAAEAYDDGIDRIHAKSPSERTYKDEEEYAEVVAFNAALAAESLLEDNEELVTPP